MPFQVIHSTLLLLCVLEVQQNKIFQMLKIEYQKKVRHMHSFMNTFLSITEAGMSLNSLRRSACRPPILTWVELSQKVSAKLRVNSRPRV